MRSKILALGLVLKALRSTAPVMVKLGIRMIHKGWIDQTQIEAHDETRKVMGLPPKGTNWKPAPKTKEERIQKAASGHTNRPHVVRRGGKLL